MSKNTVLCVFRGRGQDWEALCLDYDIAVHGQNLNEVRDLLATAVMTYVKDAMAENEPDRSRLLNRSTPRFVQFAWAIKFLLHSFLSRERPDFEGRFDLPCPA